MFSKDTTILVFILMSVSSMVLNVQGTEYLKNQSNTLPVQPYTPTDSSGSAVNENRHENVTGKQDFQRSRDPRFLSLFTVVRFENTLCPSTTGDNGTCYPSAECLRRQGAANGKCAQGYGVCCVFSRSCAQTSNQNNTYFTHSNYPAAFEGSGSCPMTIYKAVPDVCQFRLDFETFNIGPPNINGVCNNDQFIISGSSSIVPVICGVASGNHMYIDVGLDNTPVTMSVITTGPTFSRTWKIKVTHIRCRAQNKAPAGCLQYYIGVSGTVRTYNFDFGGGQQLANQDYTSCIRLERNFCGIRYTGCTDTQITSGNTEEIAARRSRSFSLTGDATAVTVVGARVGTTQCTTDWIIIPCATNTGKITQTAGAICQERICGTVFNSEAVIVPSPVFSYVRPFRITYHTDSTEPVTTDVGNRGYCLNFIQQPCTPN